MVQPSQNRCREHPSVFGEAMTYGRELVAFGQRIGNPGSQAGMWAAPVIVAYLSRVPDGQALPDPRSGSAPLFTGAFRETLASAGVETVKLPPRSPNLNAYAERFVRSVKESCLDRLILVGEASLRRSVREFVEHYHFERNHQGLGNRLILPVVARAPGPGDIMCRERLGGVLKDYQPPAAETPRTRR